jgi:hypothetical protein
MSKVPTFVVKAMRFTANGKVVTGRDGTPIWRDAGYAYRSGAGNDERISVTVHVDDGTDYRCVLVKRSADIETKYNALRRRQEKSGPRSRAQSRGAAQAAMTQ